MGKPPILIEIFLFIYYLIKNPKLFFLKTLIWRRYKTGGFRKRITSFEPDKELLLTKFHLTNLYLKPNLEKLESDIDSIMAVKIIKFNAIKSGDFEDKTYQIITNALKKGSKKVWEPIIFLLEEMSFHFNEIQNLIVDMTKDNNGFIRETAILVMEDGDFSLEEKRTTFLHLSKDRNKIVRERVLDLIFREEKTHRAYFQDILDDLCKNDEDENIKNMACWIKNNES
jgi:hypothetical protein